MHDWASLDSVYNEQSWLYLYGHSGIYHAQSGLAIHPTQETLEIANWGMQSNN